jgi:hypothetical protein
VTGVIMGMADIMKIIMVTAVVMVGITTTTIEVEDINTFY